MIDKLYNCTVNQYLIDCTMILTHTHTHTTSTLCADGLED